MKWYHILLIWFAVSAILSPFIGKFLSLSTKEFPDA